jgi:tRNA threonylcarbamoyladenosine biosynthesis protein TsaE
MNFERKHITLDQLPRVASELMNLYTGSRIFAFYGKMGSGKTTFIREICKVLQVVDVATSPTFAIVNEYFTLPGDSVYHFDFYRIKNLEEAFDLGYEDYFFRGNYCLIEWPEKIESLLPDDCVVINLVEESPFKRTISACTRN